MIPVLIQSTVINHPNRFCAFRKAHKNVRDPEVKWNRGPS